MDNDKWSWAWLIGFGLIILSLFIGIHWTKSYFEAASYNRVTGENVSTWDAVFIQLRVTGEPKDD